MAEDRANMDQSHVRQVDSEQLFRSILLLREQVSRQCATNTNLAQQLAAARTDSRVNREARRAALNLMQDVAEARLAEQRENAERQRAEEELRLPRKNTGACSNRWTRASSSFRESRPRSDRP